MVTYKIKYWFGGDIHVKRIEADSREKALILFYTYTQHDDIISVVEDKDDV